MRPVIDVLGEFQNRYPTIEIKIEEGTSAENTAGVRRGLLDAAVILDACPSGDFKLHRLPDPTLLIAVSSNHELARRSLLSWDDVCEEAFLVQSEGAGRELAAQLRRLFGVSEHAVRLSVQRVSRETLLTMVQHGFGLCLTNVMYRSDVTLVPLAASRNSSAAIIWSGENRNSALPKLINQLSKIQSL